MTSNNFLKAAIRENIKSNKPITAKASQPVELHSMEKVEMTTTENGDITYRSSGKKVLDLFGHGAAMRDKSDTEIVSLFKAAFNDNPIIATLVAFYLRDPRGGQGERRFFRTVLSYLATNQKRTFKKVAKLVPEYGRWDDLFFLIDVEEYRPLLKEIISKRLDTDYRAVTAKLVKGETRQVKVSNLAKWMPTESAGIRSKKLAKKFHALLELTPKEYRVLCTTIRSELNIVERLMCAQRWDEVDYSKVASRAFYVYRKVWNKRDPERFTEFISAAKANPNKVKVNAGTLYPHEIVSKLLYGEQNPSSVTGYFRDKYVTQLEKDTLEVMWENLPNFMSYSNAIAFADVSASMQGLPMSVSIALAIYIADKNTNPAWKDICYTFSSRPRLEVLKGSLYDKVKGLHRSDYGGNTDLMLVFENMISIAKKHNLKNEDMPETIVILSDMQFDVSGTNGTALENARKMLKKAGYSCPKIVFWNLRSSAKENSPVKFDEKGTAFVSGFSPSILSQVLGKEFDPMSVLHKTVLSDRYKPLMEALMS